MIPIQSIDIAEKPASMRIADLALDPGRLLGIGASGNCLHYCAPTHGSWGVIRTAMLVPEMVMLFVCPAACGRHGAIAAIEQGSKDRVAYLCIEDHEIVLGTYEKEIRDTLPKLMEQLTSRPRAMIIVVSCIDDLLGTDYEQMLAEFEETYQMPFRIGRMNPISMAGKLPPGKRIQRDMYDFLEKPAVRDKSVNLIGTYQPFSPETELHALLQRAGMGPLRHIAQYHSFDDFQHMRNARINLVARPEGLDAAINLQEKFDTPYVMAPVAFSETGITSRYQAIEKALGTSFAYDDARDAMRASAQRTLEVVGDRSIAIDATATCSPFDLARALIESGFRVREIVAENLPEFERPAFNWLAQHCPDLVVSSPIHHSNSWLRPSAPTTDIAIGFTAAYLTAAPTVVPVSFDEGLYGYHGMTMVHRALTAAVGEERPDSLETTVRAYGLVV